MTVDELIDQLAKLPADAEVTLIVGEEHTVSFEVELADGDWVVLRSD